MNPQPNELNSTEDAPVSLAALDEGVKLPGETSPSKRRRKILITLLALITLVAGTAVGGWYLLRGKRVDLKANRRLPEKVASGKDLKQAAFDSLSGALTEPVKTPSPAVSANTGSAQTPTDATASLPPFQTMIGEERVAVPSQPGIAATLAAPPEAMAGGANTASASPSPEPSARGAHPSASATSNHGAQRNVTTQSVRMARPAQPPAEEQEKSTPPIGKMEQLEPSKFATRPIAQNAALEFGAMLPVRLLGVLYSLRQGALTRLELTRDLQTEGKTLRRGTVFIGHVQGSHLERAYVQIKGYLDPNTHTFTKLEGEVLGNDGGAGLRGKQRHISPTWVRLLDRTAEAGVQLATGILNRRSSSVIVASDPYGTYRSASGSEGIRSEQNRSFVEVPAGTVGFVMVTTLPEESANLAQTDAPPENLSDEELAALMAEADPVRIRAALPRMKPELQRVALLVLKELETEKR